MRSIIFAIGIAISSICTAQSLEVLDQKNGFKDFKFGMMTSDFQDFIEMEFDDLSKERTWMYLGEVAQYQYVFDIEMDGLFLTFSGNDRLVGVSLIKTIEGAGNSEAYSTSLVIFRNIVEKFRSTLGKWSTVESDEDLGIANFAWKSENVLLVVRSEYNTVDNGGTIAVLFYDLEYKQQRDLKGF